MKVERENEWFTVSPAPEWVDLKIPRRKESVTRWTGVLADSNRYILDKDIK